ncbi:hypothetical protein C2E21_1609 [Chlorella sorokiniana]|uniref:SGNH hydrolase-type esterase domain-containing protein n=1 Tax=Chlorella sorokiniana TaxID=3076 RepID=A0A2P6TZQ1_CHLSO|nr:hypothetical protein C2E21_1609 [Chlorella sorokiniana]|eukprot:PRW59533.1 hypothetical protein C2E21_1609 [Chlorella sorokiniana]
MQAHTRAGASLSASSAASSSSNSPRADATAAQYRLPSWRDSPSVANAAWYKPALNRRQLSRGIVSQGSRARARRALARLLQGESLSVTVLGGSCTYEWPGTESWATHTFRWIKDTFPKAQHRLKNSAIPATPSSYMSLCSAWHVPDDVELVFVEYNVNDLQGIQLPYRKAHERLLRKLLALPKRPAVVELLIYRWPGVRVEGYTEGWEDLKSPFRYYVGDDEHTALANFYALPLLTGRSLLWPLMTLKEPNLTTQGWNWQPYQENLDHPNARGQALYADMVIEWMQQTLEDLTLHPLEPADDEEAQEQTLLPPLYKGNFAAKTNTCLMGDQFSAVVKRHKGFAFVDEGKPGKPKTGWVATQPGSWLEFDVNTKEAAAEAGQPTIAVAVAHLTSYAHMGQANVTCITGCTCPDVTIEGHQPEHHSQTVLTNVDVSTAEVCRMRVSVLPTSTSPDGEHKVKLSGVVLSEVAGWTITDVVEDLPLLYGTRQGEVQWADKDHDLPGADDEGSADEGAAPPQ